METAADLRPEWFIDIDTVGLTAGTSTPDAVIQEVHDALLRFAEPAKCNLVSLEENPE